MKTVSLGKNNLQNKDVQYKLQYSIYKLQYDLHLRIERPSCLIYKPPVINCINIIETSEIGVTAQTKIWWYVYKISCISLANSPFVLKLL